MTQEEKDLLLKDLCARLPYGVKMWFPSLIVPIVLDEFVLSIARRRDEEFKPYLRLMSSMTEEEEIDFTFLLEEILSVGKNDDTCVLSVGQIDWLNAHHFDYRGLIEKGLALEAPEDMYKKN